MRKLKFRAWNGYRILKDKELREDAELLYTKAGSSDQYMYDILLPNSKDLILMQYTGLKDRNGKDVYEGDILRHFKREKDILLKIETSPSHGVYAELNHGMKRLIGRENTHLYYEVIGNIYENPELLG